MALFKKFVSKCEFCIHKIVNDFTKKYQKLGMIFWKNAQALNKATQGGFFFQKQLKPMGYYSGEKSIIKFPGTFSIMGFLKILGIK